MAEGGRRNNKNDERHSGFNRHWFTKKKKAFEYRCGTCEQVLDDPQQLVRCGHQFCKLCLPAEQVKSCPVCNKDVKEDEIFPDESVRQKVLYLLMKCPNRRCDWKGSLKDFLETHGIECKCDLVACTNEGCKEHVPKDMLPKHLKDECEYRLIDCRYCKRKIVFANEKAHKENDCQRIPIPCQDCGREIPREEMKDHVDNDCAMILVDCIFKNVGCTAQIERRSIDDHERDYVQEHLRFAMNAINNISREKQKMAEEINELRNVNDNLKNYLDKSTEDHQRRVDEIQVNVIEIQEQGSHRLDTAQMATEQNFDSIIKVYEQTTEFQETLLSIHHNIENTGSTIASLHETCVSHKTSIQELAVEDGKLRKMLAGVCRIYNQKIGELRDEMNTGFRQLQQRHEEDHRRVTELQEETSEKLVHIDQAVKENATEIGNQKTVLLILKDDTEEQFGDVSTQMERDYEDLAGMISNEKRVHRETFDKLSAQQLEMTRLNSGTFLWRIDNVEAALNMAAVDPKESALGQAFYSEPNGYLIKPKLFLNGARKQDRSHISVFVQLMKSRNDGVLQWPFRRRVRFTLIDQEPGPTRRHDIHRDLLPNADSVESRRPTEEANYGYGIYKFVGHDVLRAGKYIVDDTMFLRVDVLANDDNNGHSETI